MTDLMTFLTSEEIMVVYAIAVFSAILFFLIYIAQRTYDKRKRLQNTMELNRLVEELEEKTEKDVPRDSLETMSVTSPKEKIVKKSVINDLAHAIVPEIIVPEVLDEVEENAVDTMISAVEKTKEEMVVSDEPETEIQYESMIPDQTKAQAELEKLTEELKKASDASINIDLTEFEAEQEENAIISLEELLAKGNTLYEQNEITQYQDEGDEPITLQDLEIRMKRIKDNTLESASKQVETITAEKTAGEESRIMQTSLNLEEVTEPVPPAEKAYQTNHTFKSSPVISPIYGIEKKQTELELENTATLQKFDDEIRKTNEFVMTLKELQKNLE